jgi:hypothetical protein
MAPELLPPVRIHFGALFWQELYFHLLNPIEKHSILDFQPGYFDPLLAAVAMQIPYFAVDPNLDRFKIVSAKECHLLCDFLLRNHDATSVLNWADANQKLIRTYKDAERENQKEQSSKKKDATSSVSPQVIDRSESEPEEESEVEAEQVEKKSNKNKRKPESSVSKDTHSGNKKSR